MRATEILRHLLDIIDHVETEPEAVEMVIAQHEEPEGEYSNSPNEVVQPVVAVTPSGTDMHHSKNPADIKSNSISMFPGYQAKGN